MMKMIKEVILWTILLLKFFYELWLVPYAMIFTDIVKTFWKVFFNGTYVTEGTVPQGSAWAMNPIPRQGRKKKQSQIFGKNINNRTQERHGSDRTKLCPAMRGTSWVRIDQRSKWLSLLRSANGGNGGLDDDQDDHLMILYLSVSNNAVMKEMIFDRKLYLRW